MAQAAKETIDLRTDALLKLQTARVRPVGIYLSMTTSLSKAPVNTGM
jgi:hypothetical protein